MYTVHIILNYRIHNKRNIMKYQISAFNRLHIYLPLAILFLMFISSCSTTSASKNDPLEPMNRAIFGFNEVVDDNILKPVAKTYKYITPDPIETGVSNFFSNIGEVSTIANDVLQLKFDQAGNDLARFSINTTIGF